MLNRWKDTEARAHVDEALAQGLPEPLGLRLYTSRLLGREPDLVLHGGGNTSVKVRGTDGAVLYVKGSGWDLATIEAPGLPGLHLEPLLAAASGRTMNDDEMTAFLRSNLLCGDSPAPSVETLLHAFVPRLFVDHSHAVPALVLADQHGLEGVVRETYGDRLAFVPYVMPGFDLSIACDRAFRDNPTCEGLWLEKHGLFSFADTAKKSYDRMIEFVEMAEAHLRSRGITLSGPQSNDRADNEGFERRLHEALVMQGELGADPAMDFRSTSGIRAYVERDDLVELSRRGTATPDHVIRIKPFPLIAALDDEIERLTSRLQAYTREYRAYFERNAALAAEPKTMLDTAPRVVLVPGHGLYGLGTSDRDARICGDLMEQTSRIVNAAESYGRFAPIGERQLFDMEYWSLEQAKLTANQ